MAKIAPFKGIRYNKSLVGDLSKVTCPPYDVISPVEREYYHQLHPNNFIRLILGEEFESDNDSNNRFTRARDYIRDWMEEGILIKDQLPSIYAYQQQFVWNGAKKVINGFICAVKIHEYADNVILPHENTLAKPKSQLIQLIRETNANLDSIYGLFSDPDMFVAKRISSITSKTPNIDILDKDGVRHLLWALDEISVINEIAGFMSDKQIAIADGHHRYETSLAYMKEIREKSGIQDGIELPSDYTLMTLVNVYEKDMTIFPTHRVVGNLPCDIVSGLKDKLNAYFDVEESSKNTLIEDMRSRNAIGVYLGSSAYTAKPKPEAYSSLDGSFASRKLELNVLHKLILERELNIDQEKLRNQTHILYTRDANEAFELVDSGERQIAFLLNNIEVKSVLDIAASGEKMPQKATYFYPKLLSGMVFRIMEDE